MSRPSIERDVWHIALSNSCSLRARRRQRDVQEPHGVVTAVNIP